MPIEQFNNGCYKKKISKNTGEERNTFFKVKSVRKKTFFLFFNFFFIVAALVCVVANKRTGCYDTTLWDGRMVGRLHYQAQIHQSSLNWHKPTVI